MEVTLNLLWLTIALAAFVRFAVWARSERDRRRVVFVGMTTVCAVALLFPIVSMSDDLQETVAAMEDQVVIRQIIASTALHVVALLVATVFAANHQPDLAFFGSSSEESFHLASYAGAAIFARRGPPSIAC